VVDRIDLTLNRREIVGLLGPTVPEDDDFLHGDRAHSAGPGKGLDGRPDITEDPVYIRARKGITYLAQEPSVFRKLTVEENLLAILESWGSLRSR